MHNQIYFRMSNNQQETSKKQGKTVNSIDDLICEKHPEAIFEVVKKIDSKYNVYQCKLCGKNKGSEQTKAYECPKCGIVYGCFERKLFSLKGKRSVSYNCIICRTQLAEYSWREPIDLFNVIYKKKTIL